MCHARWTLCNRTATLLQVCWKILFWTNLLIRAYARQKALPFYQDAQQEWVCQFHVICWARVPIHTVQDTVLQWHDYGSHKLWQQCEWYIIKHFLFACCKTGALYHAMTAACMCCKDTQCPNCRIEKLMHAEIHCSLHISDTCFTTINLSRKAAQVARAHCRCCNEYATYWHTAFRLLAVAVAFVCCTLSGHAGSTYLHAESVLLLHYFWWLSWPNRSAWNLARLILCHTKCSTNGASTAAYAMRRNHCDKKRLKSTTRHFALQMNTVISIWPCALITH